ncbi:peptidase M28 [Shewanella sp. OPT22]|nr:peptidase M28 [Shewanella sp. OPT22]
MRTPILISAVAMLTACATTQPHIEHNTSVSPVTASLFNETQFRKDIKVLSSDEFEGRAPATEGGKKTIAYLTQSFKDMGLVGANNGSYLQAVPMVSYTTNEDTAKVTLGNMLLTYRKDVVVNTRINEKHISIKNAPLVFVGYGINAPEHHWNDYAGLDMKGKVAVIMVNDPGFARPTAGVFDGKAMTYYGRWDYKFIEASKQGAIGAIIIHDTEPASYPWSVVENSWTGAQQDLVQQTTTDKNNVKVEGWITNTFAQKLFKKSKLNLAKLMKQAALKPTHINLNQSASFELDNSIDYADSYNVVATLPGTSQKDEQLLFVAHWDHIGKDETKTGDQIYNGALDNASGTAGIMEIARIFAQKAANGEKLARSLTFVAATGEEQGLLGSRYYAEHPISPLDKTVAVFNLDSTNIYGKTKDYTIVGKGKSQLENYLADAAKKQNRTVKSEKYPEAGGFFRSDHFSFAKYGVPAVFAGGGSEPIDDATAQYKKKMQQIRRGCYHSVCDEYREDWNLDGAIQDLAIYADAARVLGNSKDWPGYFKGTEFYLLRPAK